MSVDPIIHGLELSRTFLADLESIIKRQVEGTILDLLPGVDQIARELEHLISQADQAIYQAEQAIKNQIQQAVQNVVPDALAFASSLAKSLDDHLAQLLSNIATTEDVLGAAIATLKQHAPDLAQWFHTNIAGSFGATALALLKEIETQGTSGVDSILDQVLAIPNLPPWLHQTVAEFRGRNAEWQALAIPALVVAVILAIVSAIEEPIKTQIEQQFWNQYPTKVADANTIIEAGLRGIIDEEHAKTEIRKTGFDTEPFRWLWEVKKHRVDPPELTTLLFRRELSDSDYIREMNRLGFPSEYATFFRRSQLRLLPEDAIRNAFLRGVFDSIEHDRRLEQFGWHADDAQIMRALYFFIPPVADLIHMGIRNVFNPEIVQRFTLDGDYPVPFGEAAHQQGISDEWAHKYWQAHWIMPGREAFFEMFQRTTDHPTDEHADTLTLEDGSSVYNIIGRDTLNLALRDIDTPPFYRDKLTEIAYRPLTRVDIRRMHKVGLLNKSQVERAYLDLGYNPAHARQLAEFTVRLNTTVTKSQSQSLVTNLQRHVIQLFLQDKLSAEEVRTTLYDLQFTDEEIEVFLHEAKLVRATEYSTAMETGIGKLFTTGRITDLDAIKRLRDAGVPDDAITTLLDKWNLQVMYAELPPHVIHHKELTAGQILESLADGTIDTITTERMLMDIGYDRDGADARIGHTLYASARATKRTALDAIKASYINGVIEQPEASNRLDVLYLPSEQRDNYLSEWTLARETRTERIPIATLRDMLKGNYIDEATTISHLKRHRFTDADALLLVSFWQNQKAPKGLVNVSGT